MQVNFNLINFTPKNRKQDYITNPQVTNDKQVVEYSPAAYKDFNISFGERLFRTPENFYEQDFNEKNMPKTLHKYIYEGIDTNFKRTIPPAQAMKEAFGKINFAKDLDTVKLLFPDEPLFANLSSTPNKKSREGLLGMINLLKDDPEYKAQNRTLFKNGQDDLGLYIVKKIYLEGKTLKEINKDFARDVSVYYKSYDIKPQDYAAFGIKFPEKPFWKSFIATREDFPYVYIPRTTAERVQAGDRTNTSSSIESVPVKKKRQPLSFVERKKMSEAMINWHASMTEEERNAWLEKMKIGREASVFHNYFGEIVTIAQDKVDHAGKMAAFFEKVYGDADYMQGPASKKDKDLALSRFWKAHHQHRLNYSKAMNEVIADFDKAYGEDGDSPEFKDLLSLAESIANKNEENRRLRAEARAEAQREAEQTKKMEELVEQAKAIIEAIEEENTKTTETSLTYEEMLNVEAGKNGAKIYKFKLSDGTDVSIVANLKEMMNDKLDKELAYMPTSFRSKYKKFFMEHPKVDEHYLLSLFYGDKMGDFNVSEYKGDTPIQASDDVKARMDSELKSQFMSHEEIEKIGQSIHKEFDDNNKALVQSSDQALIELLATIPLPEGEGLDYLAKCRLQGMVEDGLVSDFLDDEGKQEVLNMIKINLSRDLSHYHGATAALLDSSTLADGLGILNGAKPLTSQQQKFLDDRVTYYRTPLSTGETRKITLKLVNEMLNFDLRSALGKDVETIADVYEASMATVKKHPEVRSILTSLLQRRYVTPENSTLRCLLDPKTDKKVLDAKLYKVVTDIMHKDPDFFKLVVCIDKEIMAKFLKHKDPELYHTLLAFREITGASLADYYKK